MNAEPRLSLLLINWNPAKYAPGPLLKSWAALIPIEKGAIAPGFKSGTLYSWPFGISSVGKTEVKAVFSALLFTRGSERRSLKDKLVKFALVLFR